MSYSGTNNGPMWGYQSERYIVTGWHGAYESTWRVVDTQQPLDDEDDMGYAVEQWRVPCDDANGYWEAVRVCCEWNAGSRTTSSTLLEEAR